MKKASLLITTLAIIMLTACAPANNQNSSGGSGSSNISTTEITEEMKAAITQNINIWELSFSGATLEEVKQYYSFDMFPTAYCQENGIAERADGALDITDQTNSEILQLFFGFTSENQALYCYADNEGVGTPISFTRLESGEIQVITDRTMRA